MGSDEQLTEIAGEVLVNGPMQVVLIDRDRRITYLSRYEHGFTPKDVIGVPVDRHIPPHHKDVVLQAIDRAFADGEEAVYETDVESPDGSVRYRVWVSPVQRDGAIELVSMLSTDITVEYRARIALQEKQSALQDSEERFRLLVDQAPEAIVILDLDTGLFVDANPTALRLFGRTKEELVAMGPADVSPEKQADGAASSALARKATERAAAGQRPVFEWLHLDGRGDPVECEVRLLRLPYSHRRWVRGSITDISERKQAARENARLAEQLAHAQKMEAIGQLTGGVAHDFNNLLTVLSASTALISLNPGDQDAVSEYCLELQGAIDRAAALTGRLLAFSRKTALQPRPVTVAKVVHRMEELFCRTLGEAIAIEIRLPDNLWRCRVDPAQLENALLNLAINARDAMPGGGQITIAARNLSLGPHEQATGRSDLAPGDYVRLTVEDDGDGIEPELLHKVVEPFFTTKDVGEGSGLGLSMVYGFVKQSGGQFTLDSQVGKGTRVTLDLPRDESGEKRAESHAADEPLKRVGNGRTLLVVEDQESLREIIATLVDRLGFRALSAADGEEALAILERESVEMLLTDMVLPGGLDGVEIARVARERQPALRVLYMSGYTDAGGSLDAPLVHKPFTLASLTEAIKGVLDI